uniref:Cytochrome c oxidase assembly factor 6 n=1 Tax=Gasterosteus aculeatus aculeatus TaxID=481459 RepID=A0AAQ4R8Q2_GASAC
MTAPNSTERKACWDARDRLWKCLDDNGDKVASCHKFQSEFEADCPSQWVNHRLLLLNICDQRAPYLMSESMKHMHCFTGHNINHSEKLLFKIILDGERPWSFEGAPAGCFSCPFCLPDR